MKRKTFVLPALLALACFTVALPAFAQEMKLNGMNHSKDGRNTPNEWRDSLKIIPSGTEFAVRSKEMINSRTDFVGQLFLAVIERDILDSTGALAIPRGSDAELVLQKAKGGTGTATSEFVLDLEAVTLAGLRYLIITRDVDEKERHAIGADAESREIVGRGWAQGALNGAITGGEKGEVLIAGVGAVAGAEGQVLTKGSEVWVPAETALNFALEIDVRLEPPR